MPFTERDSDNLQALADRWAPQDNYEPEPEPESDLKS